MNALSAVGQIQHGERRTVLAYRMIVTMCAALVIGLQDSGPSRRMALLGAVALGLVGITALEARLPTGLLALAIPFVTIAAGFLLQGRVEPVWGVGIPMLSASAVLALRFIDPRMFDAGDAAAVAAIAGWSVWFGVSVAVTSLLVGAMINGLVAAVVLLRSTAEDRFFPMAPGLVIGALLTVGLAA